METLKDLPLLNTGSTPISQATLNFYISTFAGGSGPNGTYYLTDFIGTAIGVTVGTYFSQAAAIIARRQADGTLNTLSSIYANMLGSVDGSFGPAGSGPIVIPSGPGAGTYASSSLAIAALIPLANAQIVILQSTMAADAATLNTLWTNICNKVITEVNNLQKCSIDLNQLIGSDKFGVLGLVFQLNGLGNDTILNGAGQFFAEIADTTTLTGQAIIGCLREGRNNSKMDLTKIGRDNVVSSVPESVPPQASLSNSSYTVQEARALVRQIQQAQV